MADEHEHPEICLWELSRPFTPYERATQTMTSWNALLYLLRRFQHTLAFFWWPQSLSCPRLHFAPKPVESRRISENFLDLTRPREKSQVSEKNASLSKKAAAAIGNTEASVLAPSQRVQQGITRCWNLRSSLLGATALFQTFPLDSQTGGGYKFYIRRGSNRCGDCDVVEIGS